MLNFEEIDFLGEITLRRVERGLEHLQTDQDACLDLACLHHAADNWTFLEIQHSKLRKIAFLSSLCTIKGLRSI